MENILRLGEQEVKTTGAANPYAVIIEEVFGLDKIEFLQSHENMEIYQKAFDIIERYFGTEEEDKEVRKKNFKILVGLFSSPKRIFSAFLSAFLNQSLSPDCTCNRRKHEPVQFPAGWG